MLEASSFDPQEVYAAVDRHRLDDQQPYIYRTRDGGATWQYVTAGIPTGSYLNAVRADPQRHGLLYAGTETGPYVSFDDGDNWLPLQLNLPNVSIRDFSVRGDSLAIATHGRALWVLDDLAPLRQLSGNVVSGDAWLFAPATAVRVRPGDDQGERVPPEEPAAPNPPEGAPIDYNLHVKPSEALGLEILDAQKRMVRRWSSNDQPVIPNPSHYPYPAKYLHRREPPSATPGLHQFVWDLHYTPVPALTQSGRPAGQGLLAPPGRYAVRMTVGGPTLDRPLDIMKDPRVSASDADLSAQFELAQRIEGARVSGASAYRSVKLALKQLNQKQGSKAACSAAAAASGSRQLSAIAGAPARESPDNSMGYPVLDHTSLYYLTGQLEALEIAVESADTVPTLDQRRAFTIIAGMLGNTVKRVPHTICGVTVSGTKGS